MMNTNKVVNNILGGMPKKDVKSKNRRSLRQWISDNKDALDEAIERVAPGAPKNMREREMWVQNDEGLYRLWKQDVDLKDL